jgi:hypothetical protein
VRILLLDHYYPAFAEQWYATHPGLAEASYAEQRQSFGSALFGGTTFEVDALRDLGHEAAVAHINLQAQVEDFKPDVVHVQTMDTIDTTLIPSIRGMARLVVGQIAAPLPIERALAGYQLVVSSLPNFVARFRAAGLDSEWLPLAFEPKVLDAVGPTERNVPVSFIGSLFSVHSERIELLEAVGAQVPVDLWTGETRGLRRDSPLRARIHGAVWGKEMYRALGTSVMTINSHIDVAGEYANNLRLYEATGMGALLITDQKVNLGELFEVGTEVVAYTDAESCVRLVRHYLDHPEEAARIAAAGQTRTLRDHTWRSRMADLVGLYEARL